MLLSYVVLVKSKVKISQNFAAISEYMNFILGLNIHLPLFIIVFITYESGHNEKDFKVLYLLNCLESNLYVTYHGSINVEVV